MERIVLNAKARAAGGKGASHKIRAQGQIPAVCYGKAVAPVSLSVDPSELRKVLNTPLKRNTAISLTIEGAKEGPEKLVMVKDLQYDPLSHEILHADFYEIKESEEILVNVPIKLNGKPKGVIEGGILQVVTRQVMLKCLPLKVPASIEVDVSELAIGQSVHIEDVKFPEGSKPKYDTNFTIAVVVVPAEEAAAPGTPVVEGAAVEGAPAEGAVPAEGAAPVLGKDGKPLPPAVGKDGKPLPPAVGKDGKPLAATAAGGKGAAPAAGGKDGKPAAGGKDAKPGKK
jgi:large subunit ribosomal protein L25